MIVIVDYGMGNLRSVSKALESLGASVRVSDDPKDIASAAKLILPGVGAFPAAMQELSARRLIEPIKDAIARGIPYLGICLGLQLLFEESEEGGAAHGLGILQGRVPKFHGHPGTPGPTRTNAGAGQAPRNGLLKIPHMGWNQVSKQQATSNKQHVTCPLLKDIPEGSFFYFVHSYYADPADKSIIALETDYGVRFAAMVWKDNLYATQFHPEKSQSVGLRLLKNFVEL